MANMSSITVYSHAGLFNLTSHTNIKSAVVRNTILLTRAVCVTPGRLSRAL